MPSSSPAGSNISKTRSVPNSPSGAPPPTPTAKQIAAEYQEDFRRSAYQYDQDLSWWKQARKSFPNAGKVAGPRPRMTAEKIPFFVAVVAGRRPAASLAATSRLAIAAAEKADEVATPCSHRPPRWRRRCPPRKSPWRAPSKRATPWTRRSSSAATITTWATRWSAPCPPSCASARPRPTVKTKSGRLELADWIVDPRNPLPVARDGQSHLAGTFRRRHRPHARQFRPARRPSRRTRNCSTTWPRSFMENGWSIKKMHRMIMLSKTYQMSAEYDEATKAKDPEEPPALALSAPAPQHRRDPRRLSRDRRRSRSHHGRHARSRRRHRRRNQRQPHQHESRRRPIAAASICRCAAPICPRSTRSSISATPPRPKANAARPPSPRRRCSS